MCREVARRRTRCPRAARDRAPKRPRERCESACRDARSRTAPRAAARARRASTRGTRRHASKMRASNSQQFMLTAACPSAAASASLGFSTMRRRMPSESMSSSAYFAIRSGGDLAVANQAGATERRQGRRGRPAQLRDHGRRVVVVGVHDEKVVVAGEFARGEHGVGRSDRFVLGREANPQPRRRNARVVLPNRVVLRADDETHVSKPGVGERRQRVVEERPVDRDHRLESRVGGGRLRGVETVVSRRRAHARAESARENDDLRRRHHTKGR